MIKRTIYISNPAYLNLKNQQLQIDLPHLKELEELDSRKNIAIEDIGVIILDHQQITITHACIASLLENNVALITCDKSHLPTGLLLPMDGHHTQSERFRYQIDASLPLKKQLWQQTVQYKITNQAAVLFERGVPCENMLHWAKSVKSGDPDNYEGRAAAYYWKNVFPKKMDFFRGREGDPPNNLLNYGYAILRAIVARSLVSSGLLPTLGIHHRNKYNAYCLADDVMEPYRPFVDLIVLEIIEKGENFLVLSKDLKAKLLGIASVDVKFEKGTSPLMVGLQYTSASLAKCYEGSMRKINYPLIKNFEAKKVKKYSTEEPNYSIAAEEQESYNAKNDGDEIDLPF